MLSSIFGAKGAFKSLTFYGVVGTLTGVLVGHFDPAVAPALSNGLALAGAAVTVLGLRKAQNTAVREIAELLGQLGDKARR